MFEYGDRISALPLSLSLRSHQPHWFNEAWISLPLGAKTEPQSWQSVRLKPIRVSTCFLHFHLIYIYNLFSPIAHGRLYTRILLVSSGCGDANRRARCVCARPRRHVAWGAVTRASQSQLRITEKHEARRLAAHRVRDLPLKQRNTHRSLTSWKKVRPRC